MTKTLTLTLGLLLFTFYMADITPNRTCKDSGSSCELRVASCLHSETEHLRVEKTTGLTRNSQPATRNSQLLQTIVLDAGHGGKDDGCSGKHSKEKYLALNITLALGKVIEATFPEINVIYTRKTDVFIPLYSRAAIANDNKADLFISIHCNAMGEKLAYIRGTETFVMGVQSQDNFTANRENQSVYLESDYQQRYQGFDQNSNEGHIFSSIFQNAYLDRSILLAEKIEKYVVQYSKRKSRGVRQDDFVVLRETTMPSVLVETGFLTNSRDELYLNSGQGQKDMANAIFLAFKEYKEEIEREANNLSTTPIIEEPIVFEEAPSVEESVIIAPPTQPIEKEIMESEAPYRATEPIASEIIEKTRPVEEPAKNTQEAETIDDILWMEEATLDTAPIDTLSEVSEAILIEDRKKEETEPSTDARTKEETREEELFLETSLEEEPILNIQFSIQLAASLTPIDTSATKWNQLDGIEVKQERQLYKYLVGAYTDYQKAAQQRIFLTKQGFKGAFVVAYKEGKRISLEEAREELSY